MSTSTSFLSNTTTDPGHTERDNGASSTGSNRSPLTFTTTDFHNFLRTRRSIRRFKPDPVPDSVIKHILSTATYAPSAHHRQPWRFVVLTSLSVKTQLAVAMAADFQRDLLRDGLTQEKIQVQIKR